MKSLKSIEHKISKLTGYNMRIISDNKLYYSDTLDRNGGIRQGFIIRFSTFDIDFYNKKFNFEQFKKLWNSLESKYQVFTLREYKGTKTRSVNRYTSKRINHVIKNTIDKTILDCLHHYDFCRYTNILRLNCKDVFKFETIDISSKQVKDILYNEILFDEYYFPDRINKYRIINKYIVNNNKAIEYRVKAYNKGFYTANVIIKIENEKIKLEMNNIEKVTRDNKEKVSIEFKR